MRIRTPLFALPLLLGVASPALAQELSTTLHLEPTDDTWATHDDGLVHGSELLLKVGVEPQACQSAPGYDPCPEADMECCVVPAPDYNYCAPPGECATTTPSWGAGRKFRTYVRFDLGEVPEGKLLSATLTLRLEELVENQGGPMAIEAHALKAIGLEEPICEWSEATLSDTEGTTWSSLPQNSFFDSDGNWAFDVSKAVLDWTTPGEEPGDATLANCGFVIHDGGFVKTWAPLERWATFTSKEGGAPPKLTIHVAHDLDGDGWYSDEDCDEEDPAIHPGTVEVDNDADDDCDGLIDEENCDGLDNDCDGSVDESPGMCGEGAACVHGSCEPTCHDECSLPLGKDCQQDETGAWQVMGCGQGDADPCLDWIFSSKCAPGWNCNYGSCSTNCVDEEGCEEAGPGCVEAGVGLTATATCGQYDEDECLEWGEVQACPAGTACDPETLACEGSPCEELCVPGSTKCDETTGLLLTCWSWTEGSPCMSWDSGVACQEGTFCDGGACTGQTCEEPEPEPQPDPVAEPEEEPEADVSEPDAEADANEPSGEPEVTEPSAEPDATEPEPQPQPEEEPEAQPEPSEPEAQPAAEAEGGPDGEASGEPEAAAGEGGGSSKKRKKGGCHSGATPSEAPWLLALLALLGWRPRERRRRA